MSVNENTQSVQPTFIGEMVSEFYDLLGEVYIEYQNLTEKPMIPINPPQNKRRTRVKNVDNANAETSTTVETIVEGGIDVEVKDINVLKKEQSFQEYFLYKLYFNYGIKRRMISDNIVLLFYVKSLKGYSVNSYITMLCRHMMLDLTTMRIISLGIPKAMKYEQFVNKYNIDMDNSETNFSSGRTPKHRIYKFPEGTMIVYNPSLKKYNVEQLASVEQHQEEIDNDDAEKEASEVIQKNIEQQFSQQFQYSTRKVVGTGRFSSLKTFLEMFNENNEIANTNLDAIPAEIIENKALVFNIEHPENRIISNHLRNFNTLCGVFQFKTEEQCKEEFNKIMMLEFNTENASKIKDAFAVLGKDMVSQIHVATFKKQVQEYGVNFHMPEVIKSFESKNVEGVSETINTDELSFNQLVNIVNNRPKEFQGYIIYGINGERTKIMNNKYKELKVLKGNKPIVIEQWNTRNLFYLYWRLVKQQLIPEFIAEFDQTGGWSYNQLFYWFASIARGYAVNLFRVYHNSFVKKTMDKYTIPYSMKPLCGDLHNMYKNNKVPISLTMVEQYIFEQPVGKIFWRLFSNN